MLHVISCPDCNVPAEITERFSLPSTDGPVQHLALFCAAGHHFRMAADRLSAQEEEQLAAQETRAGPGARADRQPRTSWAASPPAGRLVRTCRFLGGLTRRVGILLDHGASAAAVLPARRSRPPGWGTQPLVLTRGHTTASRWLPGGERPPAPPETLRLIIAPAMLPRTVQLCIHCRHSPAGFWVNRKNGKVVRRPWCLSCCQGLDSSRCDVIPFGS